MSQSINKKQTKGNEESEERIEAVNWPVVALLLIVMAAIIVAAFFYLS